MKVLLGSYDNWDIVESGYEKPDDVAVLSDAEKMALKDSNKKDQRALYTIIQGVDESTFEKNFKCKNGERRVWDSAEIIPGCRESQKGSAPHYKKKVNRHHRLDISHPCH